MDTVKCLVIIFSLSGCASKSLCQQYCTSKSYNRSLESVDKCSCFQAEEAEDKKIIYFNRTQSLGEFEELD